MKAEPNDTKPGCTEISVQPGLLMSSGSRLAGICHHYISGLSRKSLYEWAHYTAKKGAVKMHTLLDHDSLLPEFVNITDGKCGDDRGAFSIPVQPHSVVVADRGYCDFSLLDNWDSRNVFLVVKHKDNLLYSRIKELPLPEKRAQNVLIDDVIELEGTLTKGEIRKTAQTHSRME